MKTKDVNYVHIVGNLGQKPVFKKITKDEKEMKLSTFSVATNLRFKSEENWESKTTWHNVIAWNETAEFMKSLESGDKVDLSGYLTSTKFRDQDGKMQQSYKIVCEHIRKLN